MEVCRKIANSLDGTELRLGLPGGGVEGDVVKNSAANGKRGFEEIVDLKLKLSPKGTCANNIDQNAEKAVKISPKDKKCLPCSNDPTKPPSKAKVVGWPPVRSIRKNILAVQKSSDEEREKKVGSNKPVFVKVSVDGAPYLRKVDLKMYKSYQELSDALGNMFRFFTMGNCGSQGMKDFMNESKLMDLLSGSDYVPTYEDKDGDWMLVEDVPWEHIVGLAGSPGAGKSTVASEIVQRVNKLWFKTSYSFDSLVEPPVVATVLPMDGFHLYRHQLDEMEDPEEAHARRGAPWTFDPEGLLKCLKSLRNQGSVYAPSFDHGVGDPVEDGIFVNLQHKVVIVEGNYLLLEDGAWKAISSVFDEKWFIEVDIETAMQRVLKRHILTGKPPDIAKWRIEYNDRPNAELINKSKKNADLIIKSVDF